MAFGQFFSQRFGYAAHALGYMGKKPYGSLTTLPELAEWMQCVWKDASQTYLSAVIQRLARSGILQSVRGITGGYMLVRPADKITLRDLAESLEGVSTDRCALSLGPDCPSGGKCGIRRTLTDLVEGFLQSLDEITVADISDGMTIRIPKGLSV
jgi:Rrf2 family protein